MKKILAILLSGALCLSLGACNKNEENKPADQTTAASAENTTAVDTTNMSDEELREVMIERSLMTTGDETRMMNVLKKAENGEEITVGYIGGSITEGISAGAELCWAKLSYNWLCEKYPDTKINFINAGMSGTPSTLGVIRCERDLYSEFTPDIVFIEFAVNDAQDATAKAAYESLVKKIMKKENNPAVVLLFTVLKNGYAAQPHMSEIGEYYGLPMISVGNAINPELENGTLTWEKYSDDESHPNIWGHELVRDFVANYWTAVMQKLSAVEAVPEITPLPETALFSTEYEDMTLLDSENLAADALGSFTVTPNVLPQFPNDWEDKLAGTDAIEFTIECKNLFMIYRCNTSDYFGTVDVYVDGQLYTTVNSSSEKGWNNPETALIYSGSEKAVHKFTIKVQEDRTYFGLLGFGAC